MKRKMLFAAALVLVAVVLAETAAASPLLGSPLFGKSKPERAGGEDFLPADRGERQAEQARGLNARQAAQQAQSLNGGGRVLSVDAATGGWRVKLLKDGNVRFVFVPD